MGTGADSPATITHCFVLKGFDLVWSMLEGEKVFPGGIADEGGCETLVVLSQVTLLRD